MAKIISHLGTVENVGEKHIIVRITQASACSSCVAKNLCSSAESKEKLVRAKHDGGIYKQGDSVVLTGSLEMGMKAVWWAYILPLIWLVLLLLTLTYTMGNEPLAALASLGGLMLYYAGLYFNRERLSRKFSFTVKHIN